ncbi:MAG: magnesium transporter CorA family protein [Gemmatimonadaceae bacterium]|nr:magnesium transporter CorA family protein [Gemmatimonadaceae bacterium]
MWNCYHDSSGTVRQGLSPDELSGVITSGVGTLWVDLRRDDLADMELLKTVFRFHPLAIEDSLNPESRVKLEEYKDFLILIVRGIEFCDETEDPYDIETANLTFFLGSNYLVTVHGEEAPAVEEIRAVLDRKPELVSYSPARLMHAIVDASVNAYFPIIDRLDEFMDGLEEKIFAHFDQAALREIFSVKRLVLSLRRHLAPQRDVFAVLTNRPSPLLSLETQIYFRDIYDHVLRINDALETFRELLSSTLDSYLSQVSNRLGNASKTLSAVATLTVPFVVVSGMWGMNFQHIPMASHPHGFWILLVVQLFIGGFLVGVLKWLKVL